MRLCADRSDFFTNRPTTPAEDAALDRELLDALAELNAAAGGAAAYLIPAEGRAIK